jgi:hypothetical protein
MSTKSLNVLSTIVVNGLEKTALQGAILYIVGRSKLDIGVARQLQIFIGLQVMSAESLRPATWDRI